MISPHTHRQIKRLNRPQQPKVSAVSWLVALAFASAFLVIIVVLSTASCTSAFILPRYQRQRLDTLYQCRWKINVALYLSENNGKVSERRHRQQWVTCSSTNELVHAIQNLVQQGDHVAELGSQLREVSSTICKSIQGTGENDKVGKAVLVDTVRKFPKDGGSRQSSKDDLAAMQGSSRTSAMRRAGDEVDFYPDRAKFCEINQLDDWQKALFSTTTNSFLSDGSNSHSSQYDVFVLDVNSIVGNDLEQTTLSIIREFININPTPCRIVLVKSLSLNQWASRLVHGQRWCRQGGIPANLAQQSSDNYPPPCYIVATVGVTGYRDTISYTVRPGDAVLEIGCHLGTSTSLIQQHVAVTSTKGNRGYCIGVDIGAKIIKAAQKRHPHILFAVGDAWRTASLLRTQQAFLHDPTFAVAAAEDDMQMNQRIGFDVVYVDVGGLSGQDGIMESISLTSALDNALEPRCIVIKSLCMQRLSSTLVPYWKLQKQIKTC